MTVHTSELGERLAQKWQTVTHASGVIPEKMALEDANWWLDAIADEIESWHSARSGVSLVAWLRGGRDD